MDITIYLILIVVITLLFVLLKYSLNVFLYVAIIVLACFGLILVLEDGATIQTGVQAVTSYIPTYTVTATPITMDLGNWKYILNLTFLSFIIGSSVFWSLDNPRENED